METFLNDESCFEQYRIRDLIEGSKEDTVRLWQLSSPSALFKSWPHSGLHQALEGRLETRYYHNAAIKDKIQTPVVLLLYPTD